MNELAVMSTSRFIHSALGSCCLLPEEKVLKHTSTVPLRSTNEHAADSNFSQAVSARDQVVLWLLGVLGISTGSLLWHLDTEGQWLVRGVSLASAAVGLSFWGILLHCLWVHGQSSHRSAGAQKEGFWFYSGGAIHLEPVIEVLKQFASDVQARSAVLLESQDMDWQFKAGYQCSPGLGRAVAHALRQRVARERQTACGIEVLDASVTAFCTPMSAMNGHDYLLVALFEAGSRGCHGAIASPARRAVQWIREILERVDAFRLESGPESSVMSAADSLQARMPVCCSVCDQVRLAPLGAERWAHWSQWLHQAHGESLTHTVCPTCAGWLYGISLPPNPGGWPIPT